ncbi:MULTISPECIES: ABC transporter permease [unclassified Rhizobium]|jgi:macrolide transport system ATP-binding/permease protein|uniref:ABC transporter permease n=1 Tax=unclassified Rhizobium TaxID=2613769 RepID=UPI0006472BA5|nr:MULTISPECIES: ABC transporter permease [unclassified Rhizobium]OJY79607.1 MAG: macrolide ABC transporter ATP-binding protein/permease [Rhizobium sp. 60-20]RKD35545.1 macrolide transport system ATP-binding/permease protein [Rhizobium sp. WW_1]
MTVQQTLSPLLELKNVTRTFFVGDTEVPAVRGVSLSIHHGEFIAIIGSSGSGKSTLMSILGCLDRPSSGSYSFEGIDVAKLAEPDLAAIRSERLGFVFQSFNLLPRTSALENVRLPLYYSNSAAAGGVDAIDRARTSLARLGLGDRERNTPGQLSGGQQQRVAIARALINSPRLLLADEPTGNLDTKTSHEIMDVLVALNHRQGVTIVLVTHEPDIAAYADRIITMRDGKIVADERKGHAPSTDLSPAPDANGTIQSSPRGGLAFGRMALGAAAQAIYHNKMRSLLTMLGVFIGVAALIVMVAIGQGANIAVAKQIESLGTNVVVVLPGALSSNGVRGGFGSASTLTVADAKAIGQAAAIAEIGFLIRQQGQVEYGSNNWTTGIQGVSESYPEITNWKVAAGDPITDDDERNGNLVALIGQTVEHQLFAPTENPIGATIRIRNVPMRVVGVLAAKGQSAMGQDQDDVVMIPFATAERRVLGTAAPSQAQTMNNWAYLPAPNPYNLQPRLTGFANMLFIQAKSADRVPEAIGDINEILIRRHHIKAMEDKDFDVRNLSQFAETAKSSSRIMALLLAAVASISLLVGGIGIMNILLVSVTERTREIGLRMAIGARRLHVLLQFLAEAIFLSVSGGIAGILMGIAVCLTISQIFGWLAPLSPGAMAGGFLFAAMVGIFFGYYPARKAANLNPIEALRYE